MDEPLKLKPGDKFLVDERATASKRFIVGHWLTVEEIRPKSGWSPERYGACWHQEDNPGKKRPYGRNTYAHDVEDFYWLDNDWRQCDRSQCFQKAQRINTLPEF